ncbi:MAG: DUF302 domain-containing protein [Planctomycetota bacterium]
MSNETTDVQKRRWPMYVSAAGGFVAGLLVAALLVWQIMPGLMIVTHRSRMDMEETVKTIEENIKEEGWSHAGTRNMNKSLKKHGKVLRPDVRIVEMCHPDYAKSVLSTDRYVSCLMPCSVAVWENDGGHVFVSKMNTGLMGQMFGGNIASVMGGAVAEDEHAILKEVIRR